MVTATGCEVRDLGDDEALVALGSNLGDRAATMAEAVRRVLALPGVRTSPDGDVGDDDSFGRTISDLYASVPIDVDGEHEHFLNAAMRVRFGGEAERLLQHLQTIESALGRKRGGGIEPRTIDLDLLAMGRLAHATPHLTLPHPRLHERLFVLVPLCDIAPGVRHPALGRTVRELRAALASTTEHPEKLVRRVADRGWFRTSSENVSTDAG